MAENNRTKQLRKELSGFFLKWWNGGDISPFMNRYYQLKRKYLIDKRIHYKKQIDNTYCEPFDRSVIDNIRLQGLINQAYAEIDACKMRGGFS